MTGTSAVVRPVPPPLEVQYPICGVCGNEVESDGDEFRCYPCKATWQMWEVGQVDGEWDDPTAARCDSVDGRYLPGGPWNAGTRRPDFTRRQCLLAAGHEANQHHPHTWVQDGANRHCWTDDQAATIEQLEHAR